MLLGRTHLQVQEHLRGHDVVDADREPAVAPNQAAAELGEAVHAARRGVGAVVAQQHVVEAALLPAQRLLAEVAGQELRVAEAHVAVLCCGCCVFFLGKG